MTIKMPLPDQGILGRRDEIIAALLAIVPGEGVIETEREMKPYESDALTATASRRLSWCCPTPPSRSPRF